MESNNLFRLKLVDGKYEILKSQDFKIFEALRHNEKWRSLHGDNLVAALCNKIEDLLIENENLKKELKENAIRSTTN